jgi:hypothetical protein
VLLCSLLVSLSVGCHVSDVNSESRSVSAAYLWGMVHRGPVLIKEDIKLCGFVSLNDRFGETSRSVIISDESGGVELKIDIDKLYKVWYNNNSERDGDQPLRTLVPLFSAPNH